MSYKLYLILLKFKQKHSVFNAQCADLILECVKKLRTSFVCKCVRVKTHYLLTNITTIVLEIIQFSTHI